MGHDGTHHTALTAELGFFAGTKHGKTQVIGPNGGLVGLGQLGKIYFVARAAEGGSDSNEGTTPDKPLLNLQTAIDKCPGLVNGRMGGDLIIVGRGTHVVTEKINFNKAGLTVMSADAGMPPQRKGERFAFWAHASYDDGPIAEITQPTRLIGLGFSSRYKAGESLLITGAAGFNGGFISIESCRFPDWTQDTIATAIRINGCEQSLITNCVFDGLYHGFGTGAIILNNSAAGASTPVSHLRIMGNRFAGVGSDKHCVVLTGSAPQGLTIAHNYVDGGYTGNHGKLLNNADLATRGLVAGNYLGGMADKDGAADNRTNMESLKWVGNYYDET